MAFSFSPNELHRLNRLAFAMRNRPSESHPGERRTRRAGGGFDFMDYRPYTRGDDVRNLDWNLYGRFRQLFVRIHEAPRQTSVSFVIDASRSMGFGEEREKLTQGQLITCGLGFIALRGGDRVYVCGVPGDTRSLRGPFHGIRQHSRIVDYLQQLSPEGPSQLLHATRTLAARRLHRGLVVFLSDFMGIDDLDSAIRMITSAGGTALGIQILCDADSGGTLCPGVVRLRDSETGDLVQVRIDEPTIAEYRRQLTIQQDLLQRQFTARGHYFIRVTTRDDYLSVISRSLTTGAILR